MEEVKNKTAKGNFYSAFVAKYKAEQEKLPAKHRRGTLLPVMRKSASQRALQAKSLKEVGGIVKENVKDAIVDRKDDMQKGMITDETGAPLNSVPIFYTSENVPIGDRVVNMEDLLGSFTLMSMEFKAK